MIDSDTEIIYEYGAETKIVSGKIRFDKTNKKFEILQLADNDNEKGAKWLLPHIYRLIFDEHAPDERQIVIG